jgi:hypothetical protein
MKLGIATQLRLLVLLSHDPCNPRRVIFDRLVKMCTVCQTQLQLVVLFVTPPGSFSHSLLLLASFFLDVFTYVRNLSICVSFLSMSILSVEWIRFACLFIYD